MNAAAADTTASAQQRAGEVKDKAAEKAGEVRHVVHPRSTSVWSYLRLIIVRLDLKSRAQSHSLLCTVGQLLYSVRVRGECWQRMHCADSRRHDGQTGAYCVCGKVWHGPPIAQRVLCPV